MINYLFFIFTKVYQNIFFTKKGNNRRHIYTIHLKCLWNMINDFNKKHPISVYNKKWHNAADAKTLFKYSFFYSSLISTFAHIRRHKRDLSKCVTFVQTSAIPIPVLKKLFEICPVSVFPAVEHFCHQLSSKAVVLGCETLIREFWDYTQESNLKTTAT